MTSVCSKCELMLTASTRIGRVNEQSVIASLPVVVARARANQIVVNDQDAKNPPSVFTNDGRLLRFVGRAGAGPGEFARGAGVVTISGDSVAIFDSRLKRVSIFDANWKFVRSSPSEITPYSVEQVGRDTLVGVAYRASGAQADLPLQLLDTRGQVRTSFGSGIPPALPGERVMEQRARAGSFMTTVPGGKICAMRRFELTLNCYSHAGRLQQALHFSMPGFVENTRARLSLTVPPPFEARSLSALSDRLVVIAVLMPDARWKSAIEGYACSDGRCLRVNDYDSYYDTMLIVVDVERSAIMATKRVPQAMTYAVGKGEVGSLATVDEELELTIWKMAFRDGTAGAAKR
ncbi:MAG: 6-bladed beta-propeller [Gemmatimonas sp.]